MDKTSGYIYILFNEMYKFYGENVYKLGKTTNIYKRINGYTTSYIKPVEIKFLSEKVINYSLAEKNIFTKLKKDRILKNREFFKLDNLFNTINIIEKEIKRINELSIEQIEIELTNNKTTKDNNIINKFVDFVDYDDTFFLSYIEAIRNNSVFNNNKFNFIEEQRNILNIPIDELSDYKDILTDGFYYQSFKRFEALFFSDPIIKFYLDHSDATNMKIKNLKPYLNKIKLIREYEKITGLKPFQITKDDNKLNTIDDDFYKLLKKVFEITKIKPLNGYDIIKFYVGMLKNICGDIVIILSKKTKLYNKETKKKYTETVYSFNYDIISKYTKCFKKLNKYDETLLKIFNIKLDTLDMGDKDFYNDYLFGK